MAQDANWWDGIGDEVVPAQQQQPTLQERKMGSDITQSGASAENSAATAERTRQITPADVAKAFTDARAAEDKRRNDQEDRAKAKSTKAFQTEEATDNVLAALARARSLVSGWSTGWGQALRAIPETEARSLYALLGPEGPVSANNMLSRMEQLKAASSNGSTGLGQQSNAEGEALKNSIAEMDLGRSPEEVLDSINRIERHYRRYAAFSRGENPNDRETALRYGLIPDEDAAAPSGEPPFVGGVTGTEDLQQAPGRKGLNSVVRKMIEGGRTAAEIRDYLDTVEPGLGSQIEPGALEWWEKYSRQPQDPRAPKLTPEVNLETIRTQTSGIERTMGDLADTKPGAALIGAADVLSGGMLDDLTSNPEATRAAMKGAELERPGAYMAGQIGGGIGQGLGMEGLLAKYGFQAGPATLSALQSGLYGYGASEGQGFDALIDAGTAAAIGAFAGKGGDLLGRGVARTVRGVTDPAVEYLHSAGVPMTVGEMVGGGLRRFEDKLADVPLVGSAIRNRLAEGTEAYNQAAVSEALAPLAAKYQLANPEVGAKGVRAARGQASQAFRDALGGLNVAPDGEYAAGIQKALADLGGIRDAGSSVLGAVNDRMGDLLKRTTLRRKTGWQPRARATLTGDEVQEALRGIDKVRGQFAKNEMFGSSIAPRLDALEGEIRGLVNRQAPDALQAYDAARAAWRKTSVLGDAVETASRRAGGERGLVTPDELYSAGTRNGARFGGTNPGGKGGYPFQDLAEAGQDVLLPRMRRSFGYGLPLTAGTVAGALDYLGQPQSVNPQTGEITSRRDPVSSLTTAGGVAALMALPYSRSAQGALQSLLMAPRSDGVERLGELLVKYGPGAGRSGAGMAGASSLSAGLPDAGPPSVDDMSYRLPPPIAASISAARDEQSAPGDAGHVVEVGGIRIPLGAGQWYDAQTDELVSADGRRIKRAALMEAANVE